MRLVAYTTDSKLPVVKYIDSFSDIRKIIGGEIRKDGSIILHVIGCYNTYFTLVVPIDGHWAENLNDVLLARQHEILTHSTPRDQLCKAIDTDIVSLPDDVLWAMNLDPEGW